MSAALPTTACLSHFIAFDLALVPVLKLHFRQSNNCGRKKEKGLIVWLCCVVLCAHNSGSSLFMTDGGFSRVTVHVLPAIGLLPVGFITATPLRKWCQRISMQHFVILPIRTRQRFDTGNVQVLLLYTSHSFCLPFLLLIGECRLVESWFFDLNDILLHLDVCDCVHLHVRACIRSHAERSRYHLFSPGFQDTMKLW